MGLLMQTIYNLLCNTLPSDCEMNQNAIELSFLVHYSLSLN